MSSLTNTVKAMGAALDASNASNEGFGGEHFVEFIQRAGAAIDLARQEPESPTLLDLLGDPSTPYWLQDTIDRVLQMDPVDVASAAEVFARAAQRWARETLAHAVAVRHYQALEAESRAQ